MGGWPFLRVSPWPSLKLFELSRQFPTFTAKLGRMDQHPSAVFQNSAHDSENLHWPSGVAPGGQCQLNCLTPFVDGGVPRFARALAVLDACRHRSHRWGWGGFSLCVKLCYQGCPAENMNPFKEPTFSELPRCLLSCPDPPMLPEGYRKTISFSAAARDSRIWVLQSWADCFFSFFFYS